MSDQETLLAPFIHLGGSGRANLYDDYTRAIERLEQAISALQIASPHPRDYPQAGQYSIAIHQHALRVQELNKVLGELVDIRENFMNEQGGVL